MISFRRQQPNVFSEIDMVGSDMDFEPTKIPLPTGAMPGTQEKVEVLAMRLQRGEELWCDGDEGTSGTIESQWICSAFCFASQERLRDERRAEFEAKEDRRIKAEAKRKRELKREALVQRREQLDKFYR